MPTLTKKLTKRSNIYFDPALHNILKVKALESSRSISELVNEAILHEFSEDAEDLEDFKKERQSRQCLLKISSTD